MEPPPSLVIVPLALPTELQALPHICHLINDLLMPRRIDGAVYNELDRVIRKYKSSRLWTVGAMDGAAARGRLDLLKKLRIGRSVGCSRAAFIGAARNNYVPVLDWLHRYYPTHAKPSRELAAAAENGHLETVLYLKPHMARENTRPALEIAARNGNLAVVSLLLPGPVVMDSVYAAAAANGHAEVVQLLMHNDRMQHHLVVLKKAAEFGHTRVMELVIHQCRPRDIKAAISSAAGGGHMPALRMLLERVPGGVTAISNAMVVAARKDQSFAVNLLLSRLDPPSESMDDKKASKIQSAINDALSEAVKLGHVNVARLLVDRTTSRLSDLLHAAAMNDRVGIMELLLDVAPSKNLKEPLHDILKIPLTYAVGRGSIEMAQLLVTRFTNLDKTEALSMAVLKNDSEMINVLMEKSHTKLKVDALLTAAMTENFDRVKDMLKVSDQDTISSALAEMSVVDNIEMVKLVLENCDHGEYDSIFTRATEENLCVLIQLLLDEVTPQSIMRGLTRAAVRGHIEAVELLVAKSDAWSINYAIEAAAMEGRVDVVTFLRDRCDRDSIENAVKKAKASGYTEVVK
ncbi:hypothetical protein PHMEG_00031622, partial [Phytophthora megakarya]